MVVVAGAGEVRRIPWAEIASLMAESRRLDLPAPSTSPSVTAPAASPTSGNPVEIEIAATVRDTFSALGLSLDPLFFGFGGRVGASFSGFYGGLALLYYPGLLNDGVGNWTHTLTYGIEGGYGWNWAVRIPRKHGGLEKSILTLRPQLGFGNFTESTSASGGTSSLYLQPGVTGLFTFTGGVFLGTALDLLVLPSIAQPDGTKSTERSFSFELQWGVRF
jgi:hypothetical protein